MPGPALLGPHTVQAGPGSLKAILSSERSLSGHVSRAGPELWPGEETGEGAEKVTCMEKGWDLGGHQPQSSSQEKFSNSGSQCPVRSRISEVFDD